MEKEIKEFESKYTTKQKEVLVLTQEGTSASRIGQNKMWHVNVTILAMIDVETDELVVGKKHLTWLMTEKQRNTKKKIFDIEKEKIYRLKIQENFAYRKEFMGMETEVEQGEYLWVREVLERDCQENRLQSILDEFQKPVILQPKGCQELVLDKSLGMFNGEGQWNGCECLVHLDVDEEEAEIAEDALETWSKLLENSADWDKKAREYAAKELVDNANDWLYDGAEEDEEVKEITEEDFARRMILSEVCISTEGDFDIYYDDDDMFWGHVIIVSGNIRDGISDAEIAG